jgi:macrodomain Ter protein organizer (MatP/YcbG family)
LGKISDFHHSKLILPSKTQKRHFNSIKISQVKNKKDKGGQVWRKVNAKSQSGSQRGQDTIDWDMIDSKSQEI